MTERIDYEAYDRGREELYKQIYIDKQPVTYDETTVGERMPESNLKMLQKDLSIPEYLRRPF